MQSEIPGDAEVCAGGGGGSMHDWEGLAEVCARLIPLPPVATLIYFYTTSS